MAKPLPHPVYRNSETALITRQSFTICFDPRFVFVHGGVGTL